MQLTVFDLEVSELGPCCQLLLSDVFWGFGQQVHLASCNNSSDFFDVIWHRYKCVSAPKTKKSHFIRFPKTGVVDKPAWHHFHEVLLGHSTFRRGKGFGWTPLTRAGNVVSLIVMIPDTLFCFGIPIQTDLRPDLELNLIGRSRFPVLQPVVEKRQAGRQDSELH
jgi:hypothetical protein